MTDSLLSPSRITAWLDCAHFMTLRQRVDAGTLTVEASTGFGSMSQLLTEKGNQHETDCLTEYESRGLSILRVPARNPDETFEEWVEGVGNPFDEGHDVIYQMPFLHDGVRGIADFLVRINDPAPGACNYEPVDAKLARSESKPGHVLQLCFYADALRAKTGLSPRRIHLWLGSGTTESLLTEEFQPYWRRLRAQLARLFDGSTEVSDTRPEPCQYCEFCEFQATCTGEWRASDSLVFVARIRSTDRSGLEDAGVATLAELAGCRESIEEIPAERLGRLVEQAELQVDARADDQIAPPFRIIEPSDDPTWGRGFEIMPQPNDGDIFLDFEGDPFWRADVGLFFLFGLIALTVDGDWAYKPFWAHDRYQESEATGELIQFLSDRREASPDMHVYHYNHTERSALESLTAEHGVGEVALSALIETGLFVDLFRVVSNAVVVGTESYGLKQIERVTGYQRGHDIDQGSAAVIEYERFMLDDDQARLDRIAAYNEDDVRSTLALREWLVGLRPTDLSWRTPRLVPDDEIPELDDQIAALHGFEPNTPEHLLGDLLGYWRRELRAHIAPKLAKTELDLPVLLEDPDVIAGLSYVGLVPRFGKSGRQLDGEGVQLRWGDQIVSASYGPDFNAKVLYSTPDGATGFAGIHNIDAASRELVLNWSERSKELGVIPSTIVIDDWVGVKPKPEALGEFAARVLDPRLGAPNGASMALLRRDLPMFRAHGGPSGGVFADEVDAIREWSADLDHSFVAIQGPPGTGKTYRGAHIVHRLIGAGQRVGITAMSHLAIDNLLGQIWSVFNEEGNLNELHCIRRKDVPETSPRQGIEYAKTNRPCAGDAFNLVAGTTWLFAGTDMKGAPVDVLIVDEAGQLALADALAASRSAENLILLGDPLQLPQVTQAVHPGGGGLSVLEHVLGDRVTMPSERGVFLAETRRMHPNVCRFISEQIYDGRLHSHPSYEVQDTEFGTGLRWLRADHADCSTESEEEAEIVASQIGRLIGTTWTNQDGGAAPLTANDVMVVAPYNDQVHLIRDRLEQSRRTRGVRVGTVDKFQGREAPVVFFTMTTSSAEDMPRGSEFLFSRNRLNVAISRARCLAYLVCTERLLNSHARSVDEMRLISTLCAFVEYCDT
jgi:predicted RecB family nuclease